MASAIAKSLCSFVLGLVGLRNVGFLFSIGAYRFVEVNTRSCFERFAVAAFVDAGFISDVVCVIDFG